MNEVYEYGSCSDHYLWVIVAARSGFSFRVLSCLSSSCCVWWVLPGSVTIELGKKDITKICLYNTDPLKPHFDIVKLRFIGVYIIFLISAQKHRLWVIVRTASPRRF